MRALLVALALSAFVAAPAPACGPGGKDAAPIPPLAVGIDALLPRAQLTDADLAKVNALRARIRELATASKEELAREVEEQAMQVLGYRKAWLKCGRGTFLWIKLKA